jgi:dGTPase
MDLADDISYSVHDVEDAIVAGHLRLEEFRRDPALERLLDITRQWYLPDARDEDMIAALDRLRAAAYWPHGEYTGSRRDQASLKHMTSQLIGRFAAAAEAATREEHGWGPLGRYAGSLVVPVASAHEIAVLKGLATVTVMVADDRLRLQDIQADVLRTVAEHFSEQPGAMDPLFRADHAEADSDAERLRAVVDQVASLTDHSAWTHYHRLRAGVADML